MSPGPRTDHRTAAPVLLLCAHGSRSATARAATARICTAVQAALPNTLVVETWVDVQTPDVVARCAEFADRPVVIVPLLLCAGYHVRHDLARAVSGRPQHVVTPALGPDHRLSQLLSRRLQEAVPPAAETAATDPAATDPAATDPAAGRADPVVLIAAGSSDPRATEDAQAQAADLAELLGREVRAGYLSAAQPEAERAVAEVAEATGRPVVALSYLVAPGTFHDRAGRAGAAVLTAPLLGAAGPTAATDPEAASVPQELVSLVLARWEQGLSRLGRVGSAAG